MRFVFEFYKQHEILLDLVNKVEIASIEVFLIFLQPKQAPWECSLMKYESRTLAHKIAYPLSEVLIKFHVISWKNNELTGYMEVTSRKCTVKALR
jgi:hypothetical protein